MNFHANIKGVNELEVSSKEGLLEALMVDGCSIRATGRIADLPPITMRPGQAIRGFGGAASLLFSGDGIALTADNRIEDCHIIGPPASRSVRLAQHDGDRGRLDLTRLVCAGQVQLIFGDETSAAQVQLSDIAVADADTTARLDRFYRAGRYVQQGAVTIWNRSQNESVVNLTTAGIEIGSHRRPVRGSGITLSGGNGAGGGRLIAQMLGIGAVHAHSGIAADKGKLSSGGIVLLPGVIVDTVITEGSVCTKGARCGALENAGEVRSWYVSGDAHVLGAGGAGIRNLGSLGRLEVEGVVETDGHSSVGCDLIGPAGLIRARAIRTRGTGSTGVQVGGRVEALEALEGIFAEGSPVSPDGACEPLPSDGIWITESGWLGRLVALRIQANGSNALPLRNHGTFG